MRALLIMPPYCNPVRYVDGWSLHSTDYGSFPPLGLLYIASYLRHSGEHEVGLLDALSRKLSQEQVADEIRAFQPDVIGLTTFTVTLVDAVKISRLAKKLNPAMHVCWGGPHAMAFPAESVARPEVDSIVLGEGERPFLGLLDAMAAGGPPTSVPGVVTEANLGRTDCSSLVLNEDLDSLPFPDSSLIDRRLYGSTVGVERHVITLLTSRGCPFHCSFCDVPFKTYRTRATAEVLREITLRLDEGYREIFFYDDTFNLTPERVIEISEQILDAGLRFRWSFRGRAAAITAEMLQIAHRAGCECIHFGVETGTDEGLRVLNKRSTTAQMFNAIRQCRRHGIRTIADFMIGLPFERSKQDIRDNLQVLRQMDPDYAQLNIFQPIPGTALYRLGVERGVVDPESWLAYVKEPTTDFRPPLWTEHLSRDELGQMLKYAYRSFYLRPKVIWRRLVQLQTTTELRRLVAGAGKLLLR